MNKYIEIVTLIVIITLPIWGVLRLAGKKKTYRGSFTRQVAMMEFMNEDKRKSFEYVQYQSEEEVAEDDEGEDLE
ncbi:hypothetical protein KAR48_11710 [bacterium]|nr:hypothetical protein [bacterium]